MDDYQKQREKLIDLNHEFSALLDHSEALVGNSGRSFAPWKQSCENIAQQLMDHVVRIGVVGAIKSGKSTFINALLRDDYLKRGAGVVTSIVTRLRRGDRKVARLFFKSWDEINAEIEQALVLFPADHWQPEQAHFDIRRQKDRNDLAAALDSLDAGLRVAQDQLNANGVLLSSYLKGYEHTHELVGPENQTIELDAKRLGEHREFVGSDAFAVYLKDIELKITGDAIGENIEIADCQGSDSPNPLHMAMIQDYLLKTHLIIYVVSSRTGLRQADIRFLSMIKKMGIADNMLFVCNCDLSEHESVADLGTLITRIREELSLIISNPQLFSFSALYHLFDSREDKLVEREKERLMAWRRNEALQYFSTNENQRMLTALDEKLTRERSTLLLKNQLERLAVNLSGLNQWIGLNRELLNRNAADAAKLIATIQSHQGHILQVESMIQSTLNGATQKKKKEIRKEIDRFFDRQNGTILKKTITFVRNYEADSARFHDMLASSGFTQTLYLVFQGFKQSLDGFMAEKINPEIIGFIGQEEKNLNDYLRTVAEPYEAIVTNALMQYEEALAQFGLNTMVKNREFDLAPDLDSTKQVIGLSIQPATASMRYSAHIKTTAVARLGFYSLIKVARKLLKKPLGREYEEEIRALEDAMRRTKQETERSLIAHFKDYQENIKFQYLLRLADAASERLYENLVGHFRGYVSDLKSLIDSIGNERGDKAQLENALGHIAQAITAMHTQIDSLRRKIDLLHGDISPSGAAMP